MGRARRRVELRPADFDLDTVHEGHNSVRRATTVEIKKLPRGAYGRVVDRRDLQEEDRDERIAARAHQPKGVEVAHIENADRRLAKTIAAGKTPGADEDFGGYVTRVTQQMLHAPDFQIRIERTREFFSLFGAANLPLALTQEAEAHVAAQSADGILRLCRAYISSQAADYCPPGQLLRTLFRVAHPSVLMPAETGLEMLTLLSGPTLPYRHQVDLFNALPDCATTIMHKLNGYEKETPGKDAPVSWMRPSDICVFCHIMSGGKRVPGVRLPRDIPSIDRPEIAPVAAKAFEDLARLITYMPSRRDRRRFKRTRLHAIQAFKQAQIVQSESLEPIQPKPVSRNSMRKKAARREKAARKDI